MNTFLGDILALSGAERVLVRLVLFQANIINRHGKAQLLFENSPYL